MGSPTSEDGHDALEGPQHIVSVPRFALAKYPVTRRAWTQFVTATKRPTAMGCAWINSATEWRLDSTESWEHQNFLQSADHPVVCVSWGDAQAYVQWLAQRTGQPYRLPSEAEWEYAARAGHTGPYTWGDTASHADANYGADECCAVRRAGRDQWDYTSPVDAFPPNPFGLYDMRGNILEWLQDCLVLYGRDSTDARPGEPAGVLPSIPALPEDMYGQPACNFRMVRGGDWADPPTMLRAAFRNFGPGPGATLATYRSGGVGFRVARALP